MPDHVVGQIVDGELVVMPRPALRHARAATTLGSQLEGGFDRGDGGPGGWIVLFEPEVHLVADVLVPDLAGWRRERLPELPDEPYLTLAPDWVGEVLSPSTASLGRVRKLRIYAREGVAWYWLVDPAARTLEVLRLGEDRAYVVDATFEGTEPVRASVRGRRGTALARLSAGAATARSRSLAGRPRPVAASRNVSGVRGGRGPRPPAR